MKKNILIFGSLSIALLLLTGCGKSEPVKTMVCDSKATQGDVKLDLHYVVTYSGDYVKTLKTTNVLTSDKKSIVEGYKESVENLYAKYKNIDHYNVDIKMEDKTLTSVIEIDYEHVDTKKLLELSSDADQLIKNGKVNIADLRQIYEDSGATCKIQSDEED